MPVRNAAAREVIGPRPTMAEQFHKTITDIMKMTPKELEDVDPVKLHRPVVTTLVEGIHSLTSAHKELQQNAHERGSVLGVQEATRNLKGLKAHVDFVKKGHEAVLLRGVKFHKEHAQKKAEEDDAMHRKMIEEMVKHVSEHPPRLTKAVSLPSDLNKGKAIAKHVKSSLSLPKSVKSRWSSSSSSGSSQGSQEQV